jgi:hypothetical protein
MLRSLDKENRVPFQAGNQFGTVLKAKVSEKCIIVPQGSQKNVTPVTELTA